MIVPNNFKIHIFFNKTKNSSKGNTYYKPNIIIHKIKGYFLIISLQETHHFVGVYFAFCGDFKPPQNKLWQF